MSQDSHDRAALRKRLLEHLEGLVDSVFDAAPDDSRHAERLIVEAGDQLTRCALKTHMHRQDVHTTYLRCDGELYERGRCLPKTYQTLRGPVELKRRLYHRVEGDDTLSAVTVRLGCVGAYTPAAWEVVSIAMAELPSRVAHRLLTPTCSVHGSAKTFERVAYQLGQHLESHRAELEPLVREQLEPVEQAHHFSVCLDRVSVVMDEPDGLHKRMAYAGCVTAYDEQGERLFSRRYGRMPGQNVEVLRGQMRADVDWLRDHSDEELIGVCLSDGAPELHHILEEDYPECDRLVDIWHLMDKLADAMRPICKEAERLDEVIRTWCEQLQEGEVDVDLLSKRLKRFNGHQQDKALKEALSYIENHGEQMRYADYVERGLPIGSGTVEATCKEAVSVRMKRNGQRWKEPGAQAILNLRCPLISHQWEETMDVLTPSLMAQVQPIQVAQAAA